MTNRLQPCLQPPTAQLLAPATSSQQKQIIQSALVLRWLPRGSLDAGTALLDATDDMLARTLTYRTSKNERASPSSCHHVSPARAQPCTRLGRWASCFVARHNRDLCLSVHLSTQENDFTGRADRPPCIRKARFHVRKAFARPAPEKCDRIAAS
jgi:hypothetical protein